jgi:hypothetical protein
MFEITTLVVIGTGYKHLELIRNLDETFSKTITLNNNITAGETFKMRLDV